MRHLRACDEADRRLRRQPEQLDEPLARHLLDHRGRRAAGVEAGVLVPRRRKPVRRQRGRQGAADHEAEVAPAAHRDEPGLRRRGELLDDLLGGDGFFRQWPAERLAQVVGVDVRKHRPLAETLDVSGREVGGPAQQLARVGHALSANRPASRRPKMMSRSCSKPSFRATLAEASLPWMISAISRFAPSRSSAKSRAAAAASVA